MITVSGSTPAGVADAADALASGQIVPSRMFNHDSTTVVSQFLFLTYFTGDKTEPINNITVATRATAAGATPTLCRMGVWSEAANGDLTLVSSIANDTALFAAANTTYTRALTSTFNKVLGQRYACGLLIVTGAAVPNFCCWQINATSFGHGNNIAAPKRAAIVTGQTDLPASVANASIAGNGTSITFHMSQ